MYAKIGDFVGFRAPSVEEKVYFSQTIYKVSSKDLGAIVSVLEEKCPKALDRVRFIYLCYTAV